jgi:hypothetical protein
MLQGDAPVVRGRVKSSVWSLRVSERKPRVVGVPLAFPFAYKLIRVSNSKGVSIYLIGHLGFRV